MKKVFISGSLTDLTRSHRSVRSLSLRTDGGLIYVCDVAAGSLPDWEEVYMILHGGLWIGWDIKEYMIPVLLAGCNSVRGQGEPHTEGMVDLKDLLLLRYRPNLADAYRLLTGTTVERCSDPMLDEKVFNLLEDMGDVTGDALDSFGYILKDGTVNFGKYKGQSLDSIMEYDRPYLEWVVRSSDMPRNTKDAIESWTGKDFS